MTLEIPQEATPVTPERETPGERAQRVLDATDRGNWIDRYAEPRNLARDVIALEAERDALRTEVVATHSEKATLFDQFRSAERDRAALEAVARRLLYLLDTYAEFSLDGMLECFEMSDNPLTPEEQRVLDLLREAQ